MSFDSEAGDSSDSKDSFVIALGIYFLLFSSFVDPPSTLLN